MASNDPQAVRARATAAAPQYQEGQLAPLSCDLSGTLRTTAGGGGGGGVAGDVTIHDQGTPTRFLAINASGAASVAVSGTVPVSGTFWQATQPVSGPLTDTQLRASAVPVSGPLTDTQLRASAVPVSGTFWQATQPVSDAGGSLTVDDGAGSLTVDGSVSVSNFPATQPVSGTVSVGNFPATQPVSGTVTANQGTAAAATAGWPVKYKTPTTSGLTAASVSVAASGDNTLVAGVSAQTVRVFRLFLVVASAVNIQFKNATAGTALTGVMTMTAGGSFVLDFSGEPWFVTAVAGAFVLNLSAAVQVSGAVYYTQS